MNSPIPPLSVAILTGGRSSRMGRNKALLHLGGVPLIEHVIQKVEPLSDDILISTNDPQSYLFLAGRGRYVSDVTGTGQGPLAAIASTLAASRYPRLLVVATDMPFLNPTLLRHLILLDPDADVSAPLLTEGGTPEPLHTIYHKRILPIVERHLAVGDRRVSNLFAQVNLHVMAPEAVRRFDPDFHSFFNVNTPEEWAQAEKLWQNNRSGLS